MTSLVLVGNAPSSGSTFLSDLLDCTDLSASGPELNIFSNNRIYDFQTYKNSPWRCDASASIYIARNCIYRGELSAYGLDHGSYEDLLQGSNDFVSFVQSFVTRFLVLRGKDESGTVFEKTPQNINAISSFLDAYPGGWFIYLVRNPVHVYESLLRRGFPPWIALNTWLVDVAQYLEHRNNPRVLTVRYEDLVKDPFQVVSGILAAICNVEGLDRAVFMETYRENSYTRIFSGRVATWSVQQTGVVVNANKKRIAPEILARFAATMDMVVNRDYANLYGFEPIGLREALAEMGYATAVEEILKGIEPDWTALRRDSASRRMLRKKMAYAVATGSPSRSGILSLMQPVVRYREC